MKKQSIQVEVKVGFFVAIGCLLTMVTILFLGGGKTLFSSTVDFSTKFAQVEGIVEGASVKVMGIRVGKVESIKITKEADVLVEFSVQKKYALSIHEDSTVGIATQGVLGDRYLVVSPGTDAAPVAKEGYILQSDQPKDLKDYLSNADRILDNLKSTMSHMDTILGNFARDSRSEIFFKNLTTMSTNLNQATGPLPAKMKDFYTSVGHMKSIMAKVDRGDGTLGALINDPSLYDDLKALLGGANRNKVLKYFVKKSVEDSREEAEKAEKEAKAKK